MIKLLPSLSVACRYICMAEEQQPLPVSSKLNRRNLFATCDGGFNFYS